VRRARLGLRLSGGRHTADWRLARNKQRFSPITDLLLTANGAIDGPYCSTAWPSACRRRCEPLSWLGWWVWGRSCTSAPIHSSQGLGRQTSSRRLFPRKIDWIVQVIPQHAIKAIQVVSTRKIENSGPAAGGRSWDGSFYYGMWRWAVGLYGGVLWSGELQGPVIRDMGPGAAW
jgi:hypothetical protein